MGHSSVVSYCSPTRYCPFPFPLFFVPAPRAYCTSAYCHVHVYRTVPLLPGDLSFDLLSPGKPSCISLCTYFAQYILLSPVLSVELCSSLYCSQSAGAPACLTLGSSSLLDSSRNTLEGSFNLMLRLGVERRGEDEQDRQERQAGLCAARLELGSTGRAGDKCVSREVSTERNTWGLTWRQEVETRVSRWRSELAKYMGKQWALGTIT